MAQKRTIFEEVSDKTLPRPPAPAGLIDRPAHEARPLLRFWLMTIFILLTIMILVGGLTRLTDSGLSITEWQPIMGAMPPLNEHDWQMLFAKYQATPEYRLQNSAMVMDQFKQIFWWEWGHRLLGRMIGLVWLAGFLGFWALGKIPVGWTKRFLVLGALGALQGGVGAWMVASGLSGEQVDVASYRLAFHLGIAFIILGLCVWYIFLLGRRDSDLLQARRSSNPRLKGLSTGLVHLAFVQILLGALVAGIDAGRAFPTWPDMNGQFFPADAFYVPGRPIWAAFFENVGLVQFMHRMVAYGLCIFAFFAWQAGRKSSYTSVRRACHLMIIAIIGQIILGIVTVLTAAQLHSAITHQFGAILLWVALLYARYLSIYPITGSIREGTQ